MLYSLGWLYHEPLMVVKPTPVPLLAVHVEATLLDHCARVEIRQTFANQEDTPIEAVYAPFSVYILTGRSSKVLTCG